MWRVEKTIKFEASHQLPKHDGKCRRLHGHSWKATLVLEGEELCADGPKAGMVVDFSDVSKACEHMLEEQLDHHHLNDTLNLDNPTSEMVAWWIYQQLILKLPLLVAVTVKETCTASCTYTEPSK
jgi:6-pyruvoyltetrahydropterin/6-carboxytetrahydropterin synthase